METTNLSRKVIVFIDGSALGNWLKNLDKKPNYADIIQRLSQKGQVQTIYYYNTVNGTTSADKKLLGHLGFKVITEGSRGKVSDLMAKAISHHAAEADHFIVIGGNERFAVGTDTLIKIGKTVEIIGCIEQIDAKLRTDDRLVTDLADFMTDQPPVAAIQIEEPASNTPIESPPETVIIVIDGPNFLKMVENHLKACIDMKKMLDFLVGDRKLVEARFYVPSPMGPRYRRLKKELEAIGYHVVLGPHGKDVDDAIVTFLDKAVADKVADVIICVAGDHIYVNPLFDALVVHNIDVEIFCENAGISTQFKQAGFKIINPRDLRLEIFDLEGTKRIYGRDLAKEAQDVAELLAAVTKAAEIPFKGPFVPAMTLPIAVQSEKEGDQTKMDVPNRDARIHMILSHVENILADSKAQEVTLSVKNETETVTVEIKITPNQTAV